MSDQSGPGGDLLDLQLGRMALEQKLITKDQLREALADQSREAQNEDVAGLLGFILVTKGYLSEEQLSHLLDEQKTLIMSSPRIRPVIDAPPPKPPSSGSAPSPRAPLEKTLGKYLLLREVGRGGVGVVYEAIDTVLNRRVALKLLLSSLKGNKKESRTEEERFIREARISATLNHPHIVSVHEAGVIDGRRYIAMEFIQGRQLSAWRRMGSVTIRQQIALLRDVAVAVQHAHAAGIIHRDLKPANVLVDGRKQPHITDFGLAKVTVETADLSLTNSGQIMGTPTYMSPEQAKGKKSIDRRTDIYALGVMLYEILAGRPPFIGKSPIDTLTKVVYDPVPPPSTVIRDGHPPVDQAVESICMKALEKSPRSRYSTAKAFADDLSRWIKGEAVAIVVPQFDPRLRWVAAGGAAALLLMAFLLLRKPSDSPADRSFARAESSMKKGDYEVAYDAYAHTVRLKPENSRAKEGKVEANRKIIEKIEEEAERLSKAGQYPDALIQSVKALERNPSSPRLQQKLRSMLDGARIAAEKSSTRAEREKIEEQIRIAEEAERSAKKAIPSTSTESTTPRR